MNASNKYKKGEFGYWWTVTKGNEDIDGADYDGDIDASYSSLTSLRGSPARVKAGFWCSNNFLSSLEHCPESVGGDFYCYNNKLPDLKYCPTEVGGNFLCQGNQITSLEYSPESIPGSFYCNDNRLKSLEHCPHKISGSIKILSNEITHPMDEIIFNDIAAKDYLVATTHRFTFKEIEDEKRKRSIKRQLGPFAITAVVPK